MIALVSGGNLSVSVDIDQKVLTLRIKRGPRVVSSQLSLCDMYYCKQDRFDVTVEAMEVKLRVSI